MPAFKAPPGTFDVLAPASLSYEALVARFAALVESAGYGLVISPMFEELAVFQRVGESTDVVRKEMYDFEDKGGRHLALRPEGTASVVRAFVQHRPPTPWKAWYVGPSFRYERPQAGRYRQHHQLGLEALGTEDPDLDVEVVSLLARFYAELGLRDVALRLNSLGDATCRPAYREMLTAFLAAAAGRGELCDEHRTHYADNPLRVLDCGRPECVAATADAPHQVDHLCDACVAHLTRVRRGLDALGVAFVLDPRLVRGLDYYTRTTFEFVAASLATAQNGVGGGGRYDGLVEALGGPPTPGIGFGTGIERLLLALDAQGTEVTPVGPAVEVFVVDTTGGEEAVVLADELRANGIGADRAFDQRSAKAQMRAADRSGARVAAIVGDDERRRHAVGLKPLRGGEQSEVARDEFIDQVRKLLNT